MGLLPVLRVESDWWLALAGQEWVPAPTPLQAQLLMMPLLKMLIVIVIVLMFLIFE